MTNSVTTYFMSFACLEALDIGVNEYSTFDDVQDAIANYKISGYGVHAREYDTFSEIAEEIRKSKGYGDRRRVTA